MSTVIAALGAIAGLVTIAVALAYLGRQGVLEGRFLSGLRPLYQLLLPPPDLYRPLVDFSIDLTAPNTYGFRYEHRYAGPYVVELAVEKPIPMGVEKYSFDGELVLTVETTDGVQFIAVMGRELSPYWTESQRGFELTRYRVPQDVPRAKVLSASIEVHTPAREFHQSYGPARLIIVKASEK